MKYSSLIFDFDGTIADTLAEAAAVYNILAQEHGYRPVSTEEIPALRHCSLKQLTKELGISKLRLPFILNKGRKLFRNNIDQLKLIDGMRDVLQDLRKDSQHFGILTSNSTENVELFLENHGIRDLFTFISSTTKLSGKAKHLNSIARTFSMDKRSMLYIGDEIRDIKASHKAGIDVAAVSWGFNSHEALQAEAPTYLVKDAKALLEVVKPA